ncbi:ACT domain-containing protein [Arthrobacter sp. MSA 4-2]|uniref:ACT domain-containing protein n=1 Tax=Arthrobacter sp. MSA 4-2 TaxID=2794349 RepID=UPI0018E7A9A7|nr:ACT domain-containing protein [Arthrobacter sp. MSA 4-2]MBJ2121685.1 ACT domain-containing protein [Arthrobacter sp. MSA 4-2]
MKQTLNHSTTAELRCDSCGVLPEPGRTRLTLANVAVVLPIELAVHALVVNTELSYGLKVAVLAVTATALVIWIAEPSVMRLLRSWLHAPALRHRGRLAAAPALWRVRVVLADRPGALKRITHQLTRLNINILGIHVHPTAGGSLDELVLSVPGQLTKEDVLEALNAASSGVIGVWPTTPLVLADGQTRALSLAISIARNPDMLPWVIADMLRADVVPPHRQVVPPAGSPVLKVPTAWKGPLLFRRDGEPFTPAESARAHRLAELAEILELGRPAHAPTRQTA